MLNEKGRLIKPEQIMKQVPWDKLEGVVIIAIGKQGQKNNLFMSSVTIDELAFASHQLSAHVNFLCGPMEEG